MLDGDAGARTTEDCPLETRLRVLVVEDDEGVRNSLGLFLNLEGHDVAGVATVSEAITQIKVQQPDVLITDYRLGDETGFDVIRAVRDTAQSMIPVIIITGDVSGSVDKGANFRKCSVVHKPFSPDQMSNLVKAMGYSDAAVVHGPAGENFRTPAPR